MTSLHIILALSISHQFIIYDVNGFNEKEEKLLKNLFKDYVKDAIPGNISLDLSLSLLDLQFDPDIDVLTSKILEKHVWTDDRLTWRPRDYGGIRELQVPETSLWTPDIVVYNMYGVSQKRTQVNAQLTSEGQITWSPPTEVKVRCRSQDRDGYAYIIDGSESIMCAIKFHSYTYDGWNLRLTNSRQPVTSRYRSSQGLDVASISGLVDTVYPWLIIPYMYYNVTMDIKLPDNKGQRLI